MENILKKLFKENNVIAIYTDKDDSSRFLAGRIVDMESDGCILELYDPDGIKDGFVFLYIDDIYQIEIESIYLQKLCKTITLQSKVNQLFDDVNNYKAIIDDILNKEKNLLTIKMYFDDGLSGYINSSNKNGIVEIALVNDDGFPDGKVYIKKENIERIYWKNKEQIKILS